LEWFDVASVTLPFPCRTTIKPVELSHNKYIIALLRSGSTGEYSILGFCIGPPYSRANTASLEPNILLYCPPTRAIKNIYTEVILVDDWVRS